MNVFEITHEDRTIPALPAYDTVNVRIRILYVDEKDFLVSLTPEAKTYFNKFAPNTEPHNRSKELEEKRITLSDGETKTRVLFYIKETGNIYFPELIPFLEVSHIRDGKFVTLNWRAEIVVYGSFRHPTPNAVTGLRPVSITSNMAMYVTRLTSIPSAPDPKLVLAELAADHTKLAADHTKLATACKKLEHEGKFQLYKINDLEKSVSHLFSTLVGMVILLAWFAMY